MRTIAAYAGLSLIWGSVWAAARVVMDEMPAVRASALRFGVAAVGLLMVCGLRWCWRRLRGGIQLPSREMDARAVKASLLLGVALMAAPTGLLLWAGTRVTAGTMLLLFAGLPLAAGLLAPLIAGVRAPRVAIEAALLGAGGMALAVQSALHPNWQEAGGAVAVLAAVLLQAGSLLFAKRELAGADLLGSSAIQAGVAATFLGMASAWVEGGRDWHLSGSGWGSLIVLGLAGTGVCYPLYYWLLRGLEPWKVATTVWVTTLVTLAEGAILMREGVTVSVGIGSAVVLASLAVVLRARAGDDAPVTLKVTAGAAEG